MNRPLLIIICDFLLISLLPLARFEQSAPSVEVLEASAKTPLQNSEDMVKALELALLEEKTAQENLAAEISALKENLSTTQTTLQERENALETVQDNLAKTEQRAQEVEKRRSQLEKDIQTAQEKADLLEQERRAAEAEAKKLETDLASVAKNAAVSEAKRETIEAELAVRRREATQMQKKIETLEQERRAAEAENTELALELKQSQTEALLTKEHLAVVRADVQAARADVAHARQEVVNARAEVKIARTETAVVREEKDDLRQHADKLATGVANLSEKSEQIQDEIRNNRPLTANSIFDEFRNNQIDTQFSAVKRGVFGQPVTRKRSSKNIVATDGERYYILYHIGDTPLSLLMPDAGWKQLTGIVSREKTQYSIPMLGVSSLDPRILAVPVGRQQAEQLGSEIYPLAADPYKFQEAVLVGSRESYYGEVGFRVDPDHPNYVKMERSPFGKLFGKFAPSRGDLVFSKTGELLGIMANNHYCAVFKNIQLNRQIQFGAEVSETETAEVLKQIRDQFQALPSPIQ